MAAKKSTRKSLTAPVGKFTLLLRGVGNPDYGQYADVANPKHVVVDTIGAACEAARTFIEYWNLGGGNWPPTPVYDSRGTEVANLTYNGKAYPPGPWTPGRTPLADDVRPFDDTSFTVPGLKVRVVEIELTRAEGPVHLLNGPRVFATLETAQAYIATIARTAPTGGGYDKTDCTIRFVDGQAIDLRIDVAGGARSTEFATYDFGKHLRKFLGCYSGRERPAHIPEDRYRALLDSFDPAHRAALDVAFDTYIAKCACEHGSTCDIAHNPATCPCTQCTTAERNTTKGA